MNASLWIFLSHLTHQSKSVASIDYFKVKKKKDKNKENEITTTLTQTRRLSMPNM
jgi:hypothetical protein